MHESHSSTSRSTTAFRAESTSFPPHSTTQGKSSQKGGRPDPYMPRDIFVNYSSKPGNIDLLSYGTSLTRALPSGSIGFEEEKYSSFVTMKATGTLGAWELKKTTIKL